MKKVAAALALLFACSSVYACECDDKCAPKDKKEETSQTSTTAEEAKS